MKKLLFVLMLVFVSCVGNDENTISLRDVTGVKLFDNMASAWGVFGNPSDFYVGELTELESESTEESTGEVNSEGGLSVFISILTSPHVYPNPLTRVLNIDFPTKIDNVWVLRGNPTRAFQNIDVAIEDFSMDYNLGKLRTISEGFIGDINASNVAIDFSNKEVGFYKVFIESRGRLVWYSVYKKGEVHNEEDVFSGMNYWK